MKNAPPSFCAIHLLASFMGPDRLPLHPPIVRVEGRLRRPPIHEAYFFGIGSSPSQPGYIRLRLRNIIPGVDWVFDEDGAEILTCNLKAFPKLG